MADPNKADPNNRADWAPVSDSEWTRGVRKPKESGGSDKSVDTLKREMMGGSSVTGELSAEEKEKRRKVRQEVLARMAAAKS